VSSIAFLFLTKDNKEKKDCSFAGTNGLFAAFVSFCLKHSHFFGITSLRISDSTAVNGNTIFQPEKKMKKKQSNSLGGWALRITLSVTLISISAILLVSSFKARATSGATIYVTTLQQKISESGGCSLQEAVYSSNFHANIAIDATDPDHFITTQCVAGTGNDTIVLPTSGVFNLSTYLDGDAYNPYGPTATPIIFSNITIEGHGATLEWTGSGKVRLFAVGPATISTPNGTASGTGSLTLRNVYVKGFHVKGGDGVSGGGGGMGAGGVVYLQTGTLIVENSTFDSNAARGGNG